MDSKLLTLKLFLDALDVPFSVESVDERKRLQKAVYLGQLSGVDLGYRFGWYRMGPYSPSLARDYYSLSEEMAVVGLPQGQSLRNEVRDALSRILPVLQVPVGVDVKQEDWLELVASYDFLLRVSKLDAKDAANLLREQKAHVAEYLSHADAVLRLNGLMAA